MDRDRRTALLVSVFAVVSCGQHHASVAPVESKPHTCTLDGVPGTFLCATYPVWENRETRRGRRIGLRIVILTASGAHPAPEPVFILAGGPGQAATDLVAGFFHNTELRARHVMV